jgi:UDP-N-acetylmuramoylalanine--D-glutamate ligase
LDYHGYVGAVRISDPETAVTDEAFTLVNTDINEKLSVIVGLGGTGLSCAKFLASRGENFKVVDSREKPPGLSELKLNYPTVECELGNFSLETFLAAKELIVSPGISLKTSEVEAAMNAGVLVTGDIDIFSKLVDAPIIAVTGSNGKSTVVAMLAQILKEAGIKYGLGGNLDGENFKPALDLLSEDKKQMYVLELSSFQLETTTSLGAEVAVLLNLSDDHMDRYESLDDYHRAKQKVFTGCKQIVINRDSRHSRPSADIDVTTWEFGISQPSINGFGVLEEDGDQYLAYQFEKIASTSELKVFGQHNISNILAAATLAKAVDIPLAAIEAGIKSFAGLPHRCQWVGNISGVDFYNDSKGTNVGAAVAAIEGLGQRISGHILLIAGGVGKGGDFKSLVPAINKWGKEVILIGQDAVEIASSLDPDHQAYFASDLQDAVGVALSHAAPGDAVLLSPACASFDMFENFQHRGEVFIESVEGLQ